MLLVLPRRAVKSSTASVYAAFDERGGADGWAARRDALLERGFANLALGERNQANTDFNRVLRLVPPGSAAARRAQTGLRGEQPVPPAADVPPPAAPKGGKR